MTTWIEIDHIDGLPIRGTSLNDLDMPRLQRHIEQARGVPERNPIDYLIRQRGIILIDDQPIPTFGGLLCFGRQPQQHLPYTGISLTRYAGTNPNSQQVLDIRDLKGTLFDLIDQAEAYLWAQSNHGFRIESGARRIPLDQYPRTALRELVVNAVAHRDYRVTGSRVKIEMFRNQIEWSSPGGLPPNVTVENILKAQSTRNPIIVELLFDAGYIEQRGMGLDTVVTLLREEGLPYPQMEDTGAAFLIRIEGHSSVDKQTAAGISTPLAQIYVLVETAGSTGISAKEIANQLNTPLRTVNHRLGELLERGLIVRVGSTNRTRYLVLAGDN
ncbi:MAG: ATP-binding protein [Oscillochloridaceae bacterium umkhey_bin13]